MNIPIDEVVFFDIITSDSTGAAIDADATPSWAVYEEDTDAHILTGNFTKRTALTGNYRGSITLSAANGFEAGKWYSVIGAATVGGTAGKCPCLSFRCVPVEVVVGVPITSLADDSIKAATFDESTAFPLKAADVGNTLIARTGADADTLKTLSDQIVTPLDAAGVRSAVGLNSANLDTQLADIPINSELTAAFTEIKGATWAAGTDTLEQISDKIVTPLDATGIRGAVGLSSANLDTQLGDVPTNSELTAAFTEIKGATWSSTTDSLEKIRDRGDAAWTTATGFTTTADLDARGITIANVAQTGNSYSVLTNGTYGLDKLTRNTVWTDAKAAFVDIAISSRLASTSYVLPLDAAGVRTAIGMATNNMDSQLGDIPTVIEFNARTIASTDYATSANQSTIIGHTDVLPELWVVPLDAAGVRTAVGLSTANLDAQLADLPTVNEFDARTVASGSYATLSNQSTIIGYLDTEINSILSEIGNVKAKTDLLPATWPTNFAALGINASGHISRVVLVDTTTTNSDMRGTDGAALAGTALSNAVWTDQKAGYLDSSIAGIDVPTAIENADAVLSRGVHHVKETADEYSLCTMSFAMLNSEFLNNDWIIYDEGNDEYDRRTIEKSSAALPVTKVGS